MMLPLSPQNWDTARRRCCTPLIANWSCRKKLSGIGKSCHRVKRTSFRCRRLKNRITMISEARCEVAFGAKLGEWKIHFFNLRSDEREEQEHVVARRLEQITKQLQCPHGLTNKERRLLNRECIVLRKAFPHPTVIDQSAKPTGRKTARGRFRLSFPAASPQRNSRC